MAILEAKGLLAAGWGVVLSLTTPEEFQRTALAPPTALVLFNLLVPSQLDNVL